MRSRARPSATSRRSAACCTRPIPTVPANRWSRKDETREPFRPWPGRLGLQQFWNLLLGFFDLGHRDFLHVPIGWVSVAVILVVLLGGIEGGQRDNFRHDGRMKYLRLIQLPDIRLGDLLLVGVLVKD